MNFIQQDILQKGLPQGNWHIVVSNPPYVSRWESNRMERNVLDFEPHEAIFVDDEDPLLFYRMIIMEMVKSPGRITKAYFEIHQDRYHDLKALLDDLGINRFEFYKDLSNSFRFLVLTYQR